MTHPHTFTPGKRGKNCTICGGWEDHSCHSMELWSDVDHQREQVRLAEQAEGMSQKMRTPLNDISNATGILERESPLFYGTGSNPVLF